MVNLNMSEEKIEEYAGPAEEFKQKGKVFSINKLSGKIAKRDFVIHQNEFHFDIKKDDDLSDIPERFHQNLKTEKVI